MGSSTLKVGDSSMKVIVLDAGHGGKDRGCTGASNSIEKDIALQITNRLGEMIQDSMPNVKVIYTRQSDEFIPLWRRAEIANQSDADLFISIHCNAHPNKYMHGAESFVMGIHKSEENLSLCKRENGVIDLESKTEGKVHYDEDVISTEDHIIHSLGQHKHLDKSIAVASELQNIVKRRGKLKDLGVNQAGFVVLYKTTMASVLVETGYLTNKQDEAYLTSDVGKYETAHNIFEALKVVGIDSPTK